MTSRSTLGQESKEKLSFEMKFVSACWLIREGSLCPIETGMAAVNLTRHFECSAMPTIDMCFCASQYCPVTGVGGIFHVVSSIKIEKDHCWNTLLRVSRNVWFS